ncbi:MAG: tRNA (guanosine(37)-N1)-methyltransferase TrmD [Geothermobacteraceae bacterium]|nr:MAG: tRNA (guanosine(37)-N1)-methyltransferase TrmD [Deltaproteobacteria bacterium]
MTFDILTLFPDLCRSYFEGSILGKAVDRGLIEVRARFLRDWAEGRHLVTDDAPYGGGDGMVMKVEPVARALDDLRAERPGARVLLMTPQGRRFDQAMARRLAREPGLVFVCGRYEGIDERIRSLVDEEVSIGDVVLTGGELPAMLIIDAVARLLPGVLGSAGSLDDESFADGLLEYPQYTRPAEFRGMKVPEVLLSGDHGAIARWRRRQQLRRTLERRPELLDAAELDEDDRAWLTGLGRKD